jgi:hypothetical protein
VARSPDDRSTQTPLPSRAGFLPAPPKATASPRFTAGMALKTGPMAVSGARPAKARNSGPTVMAWTSAATHSAAGSSKLTLSASP